MFFNPIHHLYSLTPHQHHSLTPSPPTLYSLTSHQHHSLTPSPASFINPLTTYIILYSLTPSPASFINPLTTYIILYSLTPLYYNYLTLTHAYKLMHTKGNMIPQESFIIMGINQGKSLKSGALYKQEKIIISLHTNKHAI